MQFSSRRVLPFGTLSETCHVDRRVSVINLLGVRWTLTVINYSDRRDDRRKLIIPIASTFVYSTIGARQRVAGVHLRQLILVKTCIAEMRPIAK